MIIYGYNSLSMQYSQHEFEYDELTHEEQGMLRMLDAAADSNGNADIKEIGYRAVSDIARPYYVLYRVER